ncbi:ribonuclease HII [Candidatus Microgenomates bacterium]|nr:ribonuclease HII [Candidatus Microgenomates bacterium]
MKVNVNCPHFSFERRVDKKGFNLIAGVDEVGRGCFAGPVVAGCVIFSSDYIRSVKIVEVLINDSKKMSSKQRELSDKWIKSNCISWGLGEASVSTINKIGIKKATEMAFRKAIVDANKKLEKSIEFLLIDAFYAPYVKGLRRKNQMPIVKGDSQSISIAAASIIAKVYRDNLMVKLGMNQNYKKYGWFHNKGYGTKIHRQAILENGVTKYHRKQFVRKLV